jgi:hypothetical protein
MAKEGSAAEERRESPREAKAEGDTMAKRKAKSGALVHSGDLMLQRNLMKRKATGAR